MPRPTEAEVRELIDSLDYGDLVKVTTLNGSHAVGAFGNFKWDDWAGLVMSLRVAEEGIRRTTLIRVEAIATIERVPHA